MWPYSVFWGSWHIVSNVTFSSFCLLKMKRRKLKSKREYFTKGADRTAPAWNLPLLRIQMAFKEHRIFSSVFPEWGKFGSIWAPHVCTMAQLFLYHITAKLRRVPVKSHLELFKLMLNELLWTSEHTFGFCGHWTDSKNLWEITTETELFPQNLRNF